MSDTGRPVTNIAAELLAAGEPSAVAIIDGREATTYAHLRRYVDHAARMLIAHGSTRGDRVALLAENGLVFVVGYLAIIRAGLVAVPLPTDATRDTVRRVLDDAGVKVVLASPRYARHAERCVAGTPVVVVGAADLIGDAASDHPLTETGGGDDLAALMFTSGSTGRPKGVMITHRNIAANTHEIMRYMELSKSDRVMVVLPFHYCFGLSLLHTHLAAGASVVISNQFMYPEMVLQDMNERGCTGFAGVPSTYQILLRRSRFAEFSLPTLRWLQQAGGRLPDPTIREIVQAFPTVRFYVMYGQTEATARLSYLPPAQIIEKLGSVGRGLFRTKLRVIRADGSPVTPGSDEIGEVVAAGDGIAAGYWRDPDETAKYFRNGALYTGDLARVDADGFIYIVGREREMVKCGGNRISTKEIEDVIAELGQVVEAAVVGVPHDVLGEAIVAFAAVTAPDSTFSILEHCRKRLPPSRLPKAVVHMHDLPHGATGKVLRTTLGAAARAILASDTTGPSILRIERAAPISQASASR